MAQPETHPDADLLNAFAEHALSGSERGQIVTHMAGCARCREVVYLAQAAANPEIVKEMPLAAAGKNPEPASGRFSAAFARWRVALIPAAALAAVGGVVLWVQLHPASRPIDMAQVTSPRLASPAPAPASRVAEQQQEPRAADRKPALAPPVSASSATLPGSMARQSAVTPKKTPAPAASGQFPALSAPGSQIRPPAEIHLDGRSAAMAQYTPQAPSPSSPFSYSAPRSMVKEGPGANGQAPATLAATSSAMAPAPPPPSPVVFDAHGEMAAPPVGSPSQVAMQTLQQADLVSQPTNGLPVLHLVKRARLPSGLNAVSSAVLLNRLVAVDSAGSVFLSEDGGRGWAPVFAPWTGKAVEVQAPSQGLYRVMAAADDRGRVTPAAAQASLNTAAPNSAKDAPSRAPSAMSSAAALAPKAKAAPPRPAMVFKLMTDHNQVWVSADGKIWREQ